MSSLFALFFFFVFFSSHRCACGSPRWNLNLHVVSDCTELYRVLWVNSVHMSSSVRRNVFSGRLWGGKQRPILCWSLVKQKANSTVHFSDCFAKRLHRNISDEGLRFHSVFQYAVCVYHLADDTQIRVKWQHFPRLNPLTFRTSYQIRFPLCSWL